MFTIRSREGEAQLPRQLARALASRGGAQVDEATRHGHGIREARRACNSLAGNAESRAVIRARPNKPKTERDIHRLIEIDDFQGGETLVVIQRHDHIEFAAQRPRKERVAGLTSRKERKFSAQTLQGRIEKIAFFASKHAAFAGVGI